MATQPEEINVSLFDMVLCLARAIDFLHPTISEHHLRVAYVASCLAAQLDLGHRQTSDLMVAGALHDIAAVCSPAWTDLLDVALRHDRPATFQQAGEIDRHGLEASVMLRDFLPFSQAADAIRFHHVDWDHGRGETLGGQAVPFASHILRLADHVAVIPDHQRNVLAQANDIRRTVAASSPRLFHPRVAQAFDEISRKEAFWLDLVSRHKEQILTRHAGGPTMRLDLDGLHGLARVFGRIIDYRSSYTATHSSGVAAVSESLAARLGLDASQGQLIGIAGFLHDIGKLAVSPAILDKPGRLNEEETFLIRQHPYYTHQILSMVPGMETVNTWASLHHERLDGTGYPFRTRDIPLGARIVAVADIFTAITEDRPYRQGMNRTQSLAILDKLALERAIDGEVVSVLRKHFDEVQEIRTQSQGAPW